MWKPTALKSSCNGRSDVEMSKEEKPPCPLCHEPMATFAPDKGGINRYDCRKHGFFKEKTILLPEKLIAFLKAMEGNLEEPMERYIERSIIGVVEADINSQDVFVPTFKEIIKENGLDKIFKVGSAGVSIRYEE